STLFPYTTLFRSASGLNRGLLGGEERWREPQRAVVLEVLKHPQVRLLTADIHRQVPLQFLPRLRVGIEAQLPQHLEMPPLDVVELREEVIDTRPHRHRHRGLLRVQLTRRPGGSPSRVALTSGQYPLQGDRARRRHPSNSHVARP